MVMSAVGSNAFHCTDRPAVACGICLEEEDKGSTDVWVVHYARYAKDAEGDVPAVAAIQHVFHQKCIMPWFERSNTCPTCRIIVQNVDTYRGVNGGYSPSSRGDLVRYAARSGDLERVQALLAKGAISEDDRGCAVYSAAKRTHLSIVQALLENGIISPHFRGFAIRAAAACGCWSVVRALVAGNKPVSVDNRSVAEACVTFLNEHPDEPDGITCFSCGIIPPD
jgi:hypothetical protein